MNPHYTKGLRSVLPSPFSIPNIVRIFGVLALVGLLSACASTGAPDKQKSQAIAEAKSKAEKHPEYNSKAIEHYMDGVIAQMQGNYAMAALDFQDALRLDSSATTIYSDLAQVYLSLGKYPQAENTLEAGLNHAANPEHLVSVLAEIYVLNKNYDKAGQLYRGIADTTESSELKVDALERLAEIAVHDKDYLAAAQQYEHIYEVDQHRSDALEKARIIYIRLGKVEKALQITNQLVASAPQNPDYKNQLAEFYSETGQPDSAIAVLEPIVRQDSTSKAAVMLGELYYKTGKLDSAETLLKRVYTADSTDTQTLYYLGLVAIEKQQFKQSEQYYRTLLNQRDDVLGGYTGLGFSLMGQEEYDKAIDVLRQGMNLFPDEFALNQQMGESFFFQEQYDSAKVYLEKAVAIDSSHTRPKRFLAFVYDNLGNQLAAEKMYKQLIKAYPNDPLFLNNLSYLYATQGKNLKQALTMVKQALEAEPDNASYMDTMGWVYYKLGKFKKAKQYIEQALQADGENVEVLDHLGDVYSKLGEHQKAQEQYQKALQIDPENQDIQQKVQ